MICVGALLFTGYLLVENLLGLISLCDFCFTFFGAPMQLPPVAWSRSPIRWLEPQSRRESQAAIYIINACWRPHETCKRWHIDPISRQRAWHLWKPKTKRYHSENEQHRVPKSHRRLYKIYASATTLGQIIKTKQQQKQSHKKKKERKRERE